MTLSKNRKEALSKYDNEKSYSLEDASKIVKDISKLKFDPTVDIAVRLGVDPRKANQMVRGTVSLPHGTGKDVSVLVLCSPDKENEAIEAGADYVGLDEFIDKIKKSLDGCRCDYYNAISYGESRSFRSNFRTQRSDAKSKNWNSYNEYWSSSEGCKGRKDRFQSR